MTRWSKGSHDGRKSADLTPTASGPASRSEGANLIRLLHGSYFVKVPVRLRVVLTAAAASSPTPCRTAPATPRGLERIDCLA